MIKMMNNSNGKKGISSNRMGPIEPILEPIGGMWVMRNFLWDMTYFQY